MAKDMTQEELLDVAEHMAALRFPHTSMNYLDKRSLFIEGFLTGNGFEPEPVVEHPTRPGQYVRSMGNVYGVTVGWPRKYRDKDHISVMWLGQLQPMFAVVDLLEVVENPGAE